MTYIIAQRIPLCDRFWYLKPTLRHWTKKLGEAAVVSYEQAIECNHAPEGGRYILPSVVRDKAITPAVKVALSRLYLGGPEALTTATHKTAKTTIDKLVALRLLGSDARLTRDGRLLGKFFADQGVI